MRKIGIIAFSFALSPDEPNPCNIRLAEWVCRAIRFLKSEKIVIISQWEITRALKKCGYDPQRNSNFFSIEKHRKEGAYLDSEEIIAQMADIFRAKGVKEVVVIAQPFLQLYKCKKLVRDAGFKVLKFRIPLWTIGFYKKSTQPWTRGPLRLFFYSVGQLFQVFGKKK